MSATSKSSAFVAAPTLQWVVSSLLAAYLLVLPASHAFELHAWFPWPFVFALVATPIALFHLHASQRLDRAYHLCDLWIVLFLIWIYAVTAVDIVSRGGSTQGKQLSHLLSYVGVIGVYYFGVKNVMVSAESPSSRIARLATISYVVVILFSYVEFLGKTFLDIDVDSYVPRVFDEEYNPTQAGFFVRSRGLASESGNFALYLEVMMPILAGHYWTVGKGRVAVLMIALGTVGLLLTFSAAAFVALPLALVATFLVRWLVARRIDLISGHRTWKSFLLILTPMVLAATALSQLDADVMHGIYEKIAFLEEGSARDRLGRWQEALDLVGEDPLLGTGAGGFLHGGVLRFGVINWWLQVVLESGLIGFVLLAAFVVHAFFTAVRSQVNTGFAIAILAASLHYMVISDYWLPWLWFAIGYMLVTRTKEASPSRI
jgi:hypothetical protein